MSKLETETVGYGAFGNCFNLRQILFRQQEPLGVGHSVTV